MHKHFACFKFVRGALFVAGIGLASGLILCVHAAGDSNPKESFAAGPDGTYGGSANSRRDDVVATGSTTKADKAAFMAELRLMEKDTDAMEEVFLRLLPEGVAQVPKAEKAKILRLTLKGAVEKRGNLQVSILNVSGRWFMGHCWVPEWNKAMHSIKMQAARVSQKKDGNSLLEADIDVVLMPDGLVPMENKPLGAGFRIKADLADNRLTGTYQTIAVTKEKEKEPDKLEIPATSGQVTGFFGDLGADPKSQSERPQLPEGPLDIYRIYVLCAKEESHASVLYADIRAIAIAGKAKLDFWDAKNEGVVADPVRDPFDPPSAVKDQKKSKRGVSTEDLMEGEGLGDDGKDKKSGKDQSLDDPRAKDGLAAVRVMRERVHRMLGYVQEYARTGGDKLEWLADTQKTDDPEFGPWYGQDRLVVVNGENRLPAGCGGEGPQRWPAVTDWKVIGPFPLTGWSILTPGFPDVVLDPTIQIKVEVSRMKMGKNCKNDTVRWEKSNLGRVGVQWPPTASVGRSEGCPPYLGGYLPYSGIEYSTWYFETTIESPEDQTLWTGVGVNDRCRLWLNGKLLWQSPGEYEDRYSEYAALIKIPFRKGSNTITMRLDVDRSSPYMWMRVCTQGRPRDLTEVKAKQEAVAAKMKAMERDKFVGWRGDGSGHYPDANPPVVWNQKTRQNVQWFTPLPYWSSSTAVPAPGTDCVFVTMDPHWLICLSKTDGRILWQKPVTLLDLLPEPLRKEGWALYEEWWKARQVVNAIPFDINGKGEKKWQQYTAYWAEGTGIWAPGKKKETRKDASPALVALLDKKKTLEANEDPQSVQEELTKVNKEIEKLEAELSKDDPDSPDAKCALCGRALKNYLDFLYKYSNIEGSVGYWWDYSGYVYATPITDGKHVWVKNGMDVAACFDMDGKLIWMKRIWGCTETDASMSSPRMVDGKLIMELMSMEPFPVPDAKNPNGSVARHKVSKYSRVMLALDAATGEECWRSKEFPPGDWNCSTPAVMTLTDGKETMKVIVPSRGVVIRVDDGKIMVPDIGINTGFASPQPVGELVFFTRPHLAPVQIIMKDRDTLGCRRLWTIAHGFHGLDFGGITIADNRIYCSTGPGESVRGGGNEIWKGVTVYDVETGRIDDMIPTMRKGGNHYSLGAVSAKHVYSIDGDKIFQDIQRDPPFNCAVLTQEEHPLLLAVNPVDRTYGGCALEGDRIYLRTYMGVLCVGYTGDEGRRYEVRKVAQLLLDDVYPDTPTESRIVIPEMPRGGGMILNGYGHPKFTGRKAGYAQMASGQAPDVWWSFGPFPIDKADAVLKAIGGPTALQDGDRKVKSDGIEGEWFPFAPGQFKADTYKSWEQDWHNLTDVHRNRRVVDFGRVLGTNRLNTVTYLVTAVKWDKPCIMRFEQKMPGVRAWVGGVLVADGERVKFDAGLCQLLLEVRVTDIPKDGLFLSPRFWTANDVGKERETRRAAIERRRSRYEAVIKSAPESPEARFATHVLGTL